MSGLAVKANRKFKCRQQRFKHTPSLWGSSLWDEDPSSSIPSTSICDDSTDPVLFYPTKRHRKGRQSAFTVLSRGKYQLIEHQVCKGCEELASLLSCSIMSTAWSTRGRAAARQSVNSSQHLTWFNRHVSVTVAVISTAMLATTKKKKTERKYFGFVTAS